MIVPPSQTPTSSHRICLVLSLFAAAVIAASSGA